MGQVPQPPTPFRNQVLPSFLCPPPAHLGGQAPLRGCLGLPCSHRHQMQVFAPEHVAPPQGAAGAQGFAEGKRQAREFGSEGRRLGEAERGAFSVAVALGSQGPPATQPEAGASLSPCGPAVSLLSTHQLSPQICSVTHMKRGQCVIFSWSSCPGIMAFRPGPEAREAEAPRYSLALAGGQGWSLANV